MYWSRRFKSCLRMMMSQNKPVSFRICCLIEPHMMRNIYPFAHSQMLKKEECMKSSSTNVHVVKKTELIRNTPLKRWKAIISSHGVRVDVLLKIICRCFARNVTMIKEIDKTAKFLAQKSETECYML